MLEILNLSSIANLDLADQINVLTGVVSIRCERTESSQNVRFQQWPPASRSWGRGDGDLLLGIFKQHKDLSTLSIYILTR